MKGTLYSGDIGLFEQTFKNIDDTLRKDAGCSSELDYVEQTSWILFLKYLDDLLMQLGLTDSLSLTTPPHHTTNPSLPSYRCRSASHPRLSPRFAELKPISRRPAPLGGAPVSPKHIQDKALLQILKM